MNYLILVLAVTAFASLQAGSQAAKIPRPHLVNTMDNEISINEPIPARRGFRKFVEMSRKPESAWHRPGASTRLSCEAIGSPTPHVQWLRNELPILQDDPENNEILDASQASLSRVRSTLVIRDVSPNKEDLYTCVANAGVNSAEASATVYNEGSVQAYSISSLNRHLLAAPMKPVITEYVSSLFDDFGASILLPCRAAGNPSPQIYWLDNHNRTVLSNPRMRVLESGDLFISTLRWTDMGDYTCTAKNAFGKDSAATFVYPVVGK